MLGDPPPDTLAALARCYRRQARHPVDDLVAYLAGAWRLDRRLADRRRGIEGTMIGTATFKLDARGLDYREQGELEFGDFRGPARQRHRHELATPARSLVRFADGRVFHALDLSTGFWQAEHDCAADRYSGLFAALGVDEWRTCWHVAGPHKAQRIRTHYRRI